MTIEDQTELTRLERFIQWREKNIPDKRFILLLSFIVGIGTALAALILKSLIGNIEHLLTERFDSTGANWLYLVYPIVGIYITSCFIRYIVRDDIGHGVTKILYAISRNQGKIKRHNTWTSVIASAITIGFGGSVGAEAPIVLTGSAIGSNLGSIFKLEHKTLMLLIGCGAAGAVSGIFKAPIAGLVFTLEVLMIDLTMASLLPLLVSCVTAASFTYLFNGTEAMFRFHLDDPFQVSHIPACVLLGIVCGLVSLYFTRAMNAYEDIFRKLKKWYVKFAIGSVVLAALIFLFPPLYGEGYETIELLLNGTNLDDWNEVMKNSLFAGSARLLILYLILIVLFKVYASSSTNGAGGCGGIFAPSLFLGCVSGFIFSRMWNSYIGGWFFIQEKNYALLGMAGLMSGVMHAPLTGVFLIAELTGGYDLFMPLMIVAVCAYLTIIIFEPHSIYSMRLAKKGELLTHNKDRAIWTLMSLDTVIEHVYDPVTVGMNLGDLVKVISNSKRNIYPVVDGAGHLLGMVKMDQIRHLMFRTELYQRFRVEGLMISCPEKLLTTDTMEEVMQKFEKSKVWHLPVVDGDDKYVGFVSKSQIFSTYRQVLADMSED